MAFASRPGPRVRAHLSRHFRVEPGLDEFLELKVKTPDESQGSSFFAENGWNASPAWFSMLTTKPDFTNRFYAIFLRHLSITVAGLSANNWRVVFQYGSRLGIASRIVGHRIAAHR